MIRHWRAMLLVAAIAAAAVSCGGPPLAVQRQTAAPAELPRLPTSQYLKAHLRNGDVVVFSKWHVDSADQGVTGWGERLDANRRRAGVGSGSLHVALDSVALFETNSIQTHQSVTGMTMVTAVSFAVSVLCLSNPKACFGSCPTFYASDGTHDVLQAEGFSASIAPSLEATDVDALYRARPSSDTFAVRVTNEAMETHNIRFVHLVAARRPASGHIVATDDRAFWRADSLRAAARCTGEEGDCTEAVARADGIERFSGADSSDLAAREIVELHFDSVPAGPLGLAITSRQTLLSTYLFYQALAYMGYSAGDWLAKLETGDPRLRRRATGVADRLGGIEVQVRGWFGRWHTVGETRETGPIATDRHLVLLPELPRGPLTVRLRMTRGLWRIDQVALARLLGKADVVRLDPIAVKRGGTDDTVALNALLDSTRLLTTLPGDEYTLVYSLPADYRDLELFLESRGYYLEWMRESWLADDDQHRAVQMFRNPAAMLRELAPAFKRLEPGMEATFWSSRYARP